MLTSKTRGQEVGPRSQEKLAGQAARRVGDCRADRAIRHLESGIIRPGEEVGRTEGEIECRERLGGLLKYYHRSAA